MLGVRTGTDAKKKITRDYDTIFIGKPRLKTDKKDGKVMRLRIIDFDPFARIVLVRVTSKQRARFIERPVIEQC